MIGAMRSRVAVLGAVVAALVTAGCGGGLYCRDGWVRRDQMAVFLLKAEHGLTIYVDLKVFPRYKRCPGSKAIDGWHQYALSHPAKIALRGTFTTH